MGCQSASGELSPPMRVAVSFSSAALIIGIMLWKLDSSRIWWRLASVEWGLQLPVALSFSRGFTA
jgi:hypothetical protein